jgi:ribonuclease J
MKDKTLRIIPLGGLGEVGRNMMLYEYAGQILVIDAGMMFPDNDMLGVDYIIPDMTYLRQNRQRVCGIIITHGHEDHIGAIQHLLDEVQAPVYATPLTRGLIEVKLSRHGRLAKADLHTVQAGEVIQVGPFRVEFIHVSHSIPDAVGLGIQTPAGLIVHTGDYKFDHTPVDSKPTDFAKLAELSQRGVLALLADSTNSERAGWTPSERVLDAAFDEVFTKAPGRIIIASFASLISRIQQVANAAAAHGRKLALAGPSMVDNVKMARKLGYLDLPENLTVGLEQALGMKENEVAIMCTGSQGEPTSIMGRLSTGAYHLFDIKPGDTVVLSSHPIPGNEEDVYRTINRLFERGAEVIYEAIAPVHVSGHASQEEMKLMLNLVRPKFFLPIHGELRHLKRHAALGMEVGIPAENIAVLQNGQAIEFSNGAMRLANQVPTSHVFVDGSSVGDVGREVMREREMLARDGIVMVHLVLDKKTRSLLSEPAIFTRGFMVASEGDAVLVGARKRISEVVQNANGSLQKDVESAVKSFLYNETHRQPTVFVTVSRV